MFLHFFFGSLTNMDDNLYLFGTVQKKEKNNEFITRNTESFKFNIKTRKYQRINSLPIHSIEFGVGACNQKQNNEILIASNNKLTIFEKDTEEFQVYSFKNIVNQQKILHVFFEDNTNKFSCISRGFI